MLYFRRFVWFIAKKLIVICILLGMLVCGFYMAMNISNIYVVLNDGLQKRVDVILTRQQAEELNKYFAAEFLLVVERVPAISGSVIASRRSEVSARIPKWVGGRYDITLAKAGGQWKIVGMQQTTVLVEADNTEDQELPTELLMP